MANKHSFHIPVMGIGFTIDSALKVAQYGIDSVLSLSAPTLQEKLRKFHSEKNGYSYQEISDKIEDFGAKRTTAFLNLLNDLVNDTFEKLKNSPQQFKSEIEKHINMLPNKDDLKKEFSALLTAPINVEKCKRWIESNLSKGSIDVNIMTKLDKVNYKKGVKLDIENNDAHMALRAYAKSDLSSSLVLSAGLNPKLFSYMEEFEDFYPDKNGNIKKKIILKVSDYRSALIQGRFLAKKGLWVSEYRIESGLNCGGHAFATEGFLMGPILEEFKQNKTELYSTIYAELEKASTAKEIDFNENSYTIKLSAQGGVGTSEEQQFLLEEYNLDSIGWGSPFLLVPEATSVNDETMNTLIKAKQNDFYLSKISPLGVLFNSVKNTSKDKERLARIEKGKPGSPCIEGSLAIYNTDFTEKPICTASRQYQHLALKALNEENLEANEKQKKYDSIVEKTCLCTGLSSTVLLENNIEPQNENDGVSICPGPNMFYFKNIMTLEEITDHIYGRQKINFPEYRPHVFIKELHAYIKYITEKVDDSKELMTKRAEKKLLTFLKNLSEGISYYQELFEVKTSYFSEAKQIIKEELSSNSLTIDKLRDKITIFRQEHLETEATVNKLQVV